MAGKSKSNFIQEFLSVLFGDLIAMMDQEFSLIAGLVLTENWYDAGRMLANHWEYCRH
ncbi:TPA: hypothetical protein KL824_003388 [Escherichia coli]|uniref:hypothetical protein n=1 Tax=Escherichia coli TaxID=562 RepID=UPI0010B0778C|nr:hypothetical protein [Escherichia coli]EHJ8802647.1 hypothetical protein [Escherichia coli]GCH13601.1 hypothetical protein BvCmsH65A_02474 [Escherichia coli]HBE4709135.1 hypothetical protein [Escherichia coli]HDT6128708.1 hypothetical protein [Escherichia coli]